MNLCCIWACESCLRFCTTYLESPIQVQRRRLWQGDRPPWGTGSRTTGIGIYHRKQQKLIQSHNHRHGRKFRGLQYWGQARARVAPGTQPRHLPVSTPSNTGSFSWRNCVMTRLMARQIRKKVPLPAPAEDDHGNVHTVLKGRKRFMFPVSGDDSEGPCMK